MADEALGLGVDGAAVEIASAKIPVSGAVLEHVIDRGQYGRGDGAYRLLRSAPGFEAAKLSLVVTVLPSAGCPGALDEQGLEPRRTLP